VIGDELTNVDADVVMDAGNIVLRLSNFSGETVNSIVMRTLLS
jgi:hypothetical protein